MPSRCVVWLASGGRAPAELLQALSQRGSQVAVVADAPAVLREVMAGDVGQVVLHDPEHLPRAAELVEALRTYFPGVECCGFDAQRAAQDDDALGLMPMAVDEAVSPALRLADTIEDTANATPPPPPPAPAPTPEPAPTDGASIEMPAPLITEEEVTMLLGPVTPEKPQPRKTQPRKPRRGGAER